MKIRVDWRAVIIDPGRHQAVAGQHRAAPDPVGEEFAVDDHRERVAHSRVVERRLRGVEAEVGNAEARLDVELVLQMLADERDLVGRRVGVTVDRPYLKPPQRGRTILQRQELFAVDPDVRGVVKVLVARQHDAVVRGEFGEAIGAVADEIARTHEILTEFLDVGRIDGNRGLMREQAEDERCRALQLDFQRMRVQRLHAERFRFHRALVDRLAVLQHVEQIGVLRPERGIEQTPERIDEIGGDDRVAIRPFRVAQLESIGEPVGARGPARGDAGNQGAAGVIGEQALEQVIDDVGLDDRPGQLRIERGRLARRATPIDRLGCCRRSADGEPRR